jgi:hypothetical protein
MAQERTLVSEKITDDEKSSHFDRFMSVFLLGGKISRGEITFEEALTSNPKLNSRIIGNIALR